MASDRIKHDEIVINAEGRVINHSLFVKDAYKNPNGKGKEGVPSYKVELAYNPADLKDVEDLLFQAADKEWGQGSYKDDELQLPFKDGDKMAKKRESAGKQGDSYKGKDVIRAHTIYNKDGIDGPGGIPVFDEEVKPVAFDKQGTIFLGCYGIAKVKPNCYLNDDGEKCISLYLVAFQRTRGEDSDRLVTPKDHAGAFKPVGRPAAAAEGEGRRRRAG